MVFHIVLYNRELMNTASTVDSIVVFFVLFCVLGAFTVKGWNRIFFPWSRSEVLSKPFNLRNNEGVLLSKQYYYDKARWKLCCLESPSVSCFPEKIPVNKKLWLKGSSNEPRTQILSIGTNCSSDANVTAVSEILPPFERIVHVSQISKKRSTICRIAAQGKELMTIAKKSDFLLPLESFQANVTLSWMDQSRILIEGKFVGKPQITKTRGIIVRGEFETILLCNYGNPEPTKFSKSTDCDDEVDETGNIDIAQIATQYFDLELTS